MPALTSVGTALGLQDIALERTTSDGPVNDPRLGSVPGTFNDDIVRAYDGLMFGTRDALLVYFQLSSALHTLTTNLSLAYRAGVASSITAPIITESGDSSNIGFLQGVGTFFSLGAKHKLEHGAVIESDVALHISILHRSTGASISTQIATLRSLLLNHDGSPRGMKFRAVYDVRTVSSLTVAVRVC